MAVVTSDQVAGLSNPDKRERLLLDLAQADSLTKHVGWQIETHAAAIEDPKDKAAALSVAAVAYWVSGALEQAAVAAVDARYAHHENVLSGLVIGALRVGLPASEFTTQILSMEQQLKDGHPQVFAA